MAEETTSTPLYKQVTKEKKTYYKDISDILNQARTWQYQRTAKDDELLAKLTNGQISFSNFKEYIGNRIGKQAGRQEKSSVVATMSKAVKIYRDGYRNKMIQKWNERKITFDSFKNAMGKLYKRYDSNSDEAAEIKQDIFDAQETHRTEVIHNWRVRYETGAISAGDYQKKLSGMQKKYPANTEQYNNLLEERRRVSNWSKAEVIKQKIESGKISIDKGQQLYLDLAEQMAPGTQDKMDLLGIVNDLGQQEYDKFVNKENALKTSQIADSRARLEILQNQYLTGDITKEEYQMRTEEEAALQSRLGTPLPEYKAGQWAAGKTGPTDYKSERVKRYEGQLVGEKISTPQELSKYNEDEIVRTEGGIFKRPSTQMAGDLSTKETGKSIKIPEPEFLKYYKENEITRKNGNIYTNPGVEKRWGTYISDPNQLKNYTEDQIMRFRGRIYTKPGI